MEMSYTCDLGDHVVYGFAVLSIICYSFDFIKIQLHFTLYE